MKSATVLAVLAVATAMMPTGAATAQPSPARSASFTADPAVMRGHGELALIRSHHLYLVGVRAGGVKRVAVDGQASRPQWSPDERWLAVTVSPAPPEKNPYADEPTVLWLVSPAGQLVRRLSPGGVHDAVALWSPTGDRLAISYRRHASDHVEVVDVRGHVSHVAKADAISGVAWSPDGTRLALARNRFAHGKWSDRLVTTAPDGSVRRVVTTEQGSVLEVDGWWPDGSGILVSLDPQGSGSIAADGLPLLDVSVTDGHRRRLTKGRLHYSQWLATSTIRNAVAFIAGGDRELTLAHKHLVVCTHTRCTSIPQGKHQVSFDPAWSLDGRLVVVRDQALAPTAAHGAFRLSFTKRVAASGGINVVNGNTAMALPGGAKGSQPVWGRGGSLLMVRGQSLWLLNPGAEHPRRVAGPIDEPSDFYYGHVPWTDSFSWSPAVPQ